jgi:hypothetical protein
MRWLKRSAVGVTGCIDRDHFSAGRRNNPAGRAQAPGGPGKKLGRWRKELGGPGKTPDSSSK